PDGIIGEIIKHAGGRVTDFFVKFFNTLFDKGIFPDSWTESIVMPLFKKGDVNKPSNYRGISLCDTSSKLYSTIINNRLREWVEQNNITGEYQAGFKRGYSTVDHMFTLLACVQKQFAANRKLYVAFIDFEKAFDSINRNLLWPILLKNGIKGKLFRCIKSMYNNVKARVRCGAKLTEYVNCTAGVKQGDVCSPILFCLFINELALEVINKGRHGVGFMFDAFELFILLLADDVILVSETVVGLQTQLNSLQNAASELELKVNMNKSNIIVFRKGGYLGARERWTYSGVVLPVVNVYKYLGIYFTTRLSFVSACKDLASRAKNALLCILKRLRMLNNNSV
ncbi:RNA-directed DNA polymerase, partial [Thiolapillus sp.]